MDNIKLEPDDHHESLLNIVNTIKKEKLEPLLDIDNTTTTNNQLSIISCQLCDNTFNSPEQFKEHHNNNHNSQKTHKCLACGQTFQFKKQFLIHACELIDLDDPIIRKTNDDLVHYACKSCTINNCNDLKFNNYESYLEHVKQIHCPQISCSLCHVINDFNEYLSHMAHTHDINVKNDCFLNNEQEAESQELYRCGLCKYSVKSNNLDSEVHLNSHLLTHVATGYTKSKVAVLNLAKIYCASCRSLFMFQHDFSLHLFEHVRQMNEGLYCPVCIGVEFESMPEFNAHLNKVHLNYKCGICKDNSGNLQNGHSIEEHHKTCHLDEGTIREMVPNFTLKCLSKCSIKIENVYCSDCCRFFDSSASLLGHHSNGLCNKIV